MAGRDHLWLLAEDTHCCIELGLEALMDSVRKLDKVQETPACQNRLSPLVVTSPTPKELNIEDCYYKI